MVSQSVLRDGEKRITVHMRPRQRRHQKAPGISPAKVNACWRDRADNVPSKSDSIVFLACGKLLQCGADLVNDRPFDRVNGPACIPAPALPHGLVHVGNSLEYTWPVAPFGRSEKRARYRRPRVLGRPGFGAYLSTFLRD